MNMKEKDRLLISYFRQNARTPLTKVSRKTGIPVSTIFDKLRNFEENLIVKHTSLIDVTKLGFFTRAHVFLKINPQEREKLSLYLKKQENVNNIFRVNNGYDILIEGIFSTVKDLENFLEEMQGKFPSCEKNVFFIIEDIVREKFMSDPMIVSITENGEK